MKDQWISVKDRLPEEGEEFIGVNYTAGDVGYELSIIGVYQMCNGKIESSESSEVYKSLTHWQPLPEPPREIEKEQH